MVCKMTTCKFVHNFLRVSVIRAAAVLITVLMSLGSGTGAQAPESPRRGGVTSPFSQPKTPSGLGSRSPYLDYFRPNIVNLPYGGGPLLVEEIKVYFIYYGTSFTAHDKDIMRTWINSFTPDEEPTQFPSLAGWWQIIKDYTEGPDGRHPGMKVSYGGETVDDYSQGKRMNISFSFKDIIGSLVRPPTTTLSNATAGFNASGPLPYDKNGIYMVMAAKDLTSEDQISYCAFHDFLCFDATNDTCQTTLIFAFSSYPAPGSPWYKSCNTLAQYPEFSPSPNSVDGGLDSMIRSLSHELAEATTDPIPESGWVIPLRAENADLCTHNLGAGGYNYCWLEDLFGITNDNEGCSYEGEILTSSEGVKFNVHGINGSMFIMQYMWSIKTKSCQLQARALCSENIVLTETSGTIENSFFVDGKGMQTYAPLPNCTWTVDVANATQLLFFLNSFHTGGNFDDYLTLSVPHGDIIYVGHSYGVDVTDVNQAPLTNFTFLGPRVFVTFYSDDTTSPAPAATGFQLEYLAEFTT